jgi:O-antigen/teichoic acid export membrane protein
MRPPHAHRELQVRKTPGRALSSTFATNLGLAVLGSATGMLAARLLHPTGEGQLTAIQTWPSLLATIAMLGLDSALVYFIASQPESGKQLTTTAALIGLVSALAIGAVAWFALPFLLSAQQPQVISAARVYLLIGCVYAVIGIPLGSLRGARSFTAWNVLRALPGIAWLFILVSTWQHGHASAVLLSRWYLAATFLCGLPLLVIVSRRLQGPLRPAPSSASKLLRYGLPSALLSLPQTINVQFDQLLIVAFLPARSLGLYAVAVAWSGATAPALSAVGSVIFPHVSAAADPGRQGQLLATALQSGVLVAVATTVPFMLLAPVGLPLIFGRGFAPAIPSAVLLVPAGAILAWAGIAEQGLLGLGRPKAALVAEVAGALVTVGTLPLLLHTSGIFGAAVASLLGYSTFAIFAVVVISRSTDQPVRTFVIPTRSIAMSLMTRSVSLVRARLRRHRPGRHRPPGRSGPPGRHRVVGSKEPARQGARPS